MLVMFMKNKIKQSKMKTFYVLEKTIVAVIYVCYYKEKKIKTQRKVNFRVSISLLSQIRS